MGFRMKITGGAEDIVFDERSITKVDFNSASSQDSNARATDFGLTVKVWGKMLYKLGGEGSDPTLGLPNGPRFHRRKLTATAARRLQWCLPARWCASLLFPTRLLWNTARKWMMKAE